MILCTGAEATSTAPDSCGVHDRSERHVDTWTHGETDDCVRLAQQGTAARDIAWSATVGDEDGDYRASVSICPGILRETVQMTGKMVGKLADCCYLESVLIV